MDAPNEEFRAFNINLYADYRKGGPTKYLSMLDLLDKLDNEFNCINNLGCWIRQEDPQILALTASLQNLQNRFSMLQGQYQAFAAVKDKPAPTTPPPPSSTKLNKPPQKKADDPEVIEFEGRTWKWCKKCFGGSWNRTHVTDEHQPGKGRSKNRRQPPPSDDTPPGASNQPQDKQQIQPQPSNTPLPTANATGTSSFDMDFV